jgi:hypothetical protein
LTLKIPKVDLDIQNNIVLYCDDFNSSIDKLLYENDNIRNKDIMSLILRMNNI